MVKVFTSGINEHDRMGCTKDISETDIPLQINGMEQIGECSAGSFHSGFISLKTNKLYTREFWC